ncbi:M1 family metallopeptidase [Streptomyces erythrochromogenes]|uniref:M1 family metallopeptidase n=1 Tax=Streptomyces erythrochromogenes TaxID=285574 RepID=UPI00343476EA
MRKTILVAVTLATAVSALAAPASAAWAADHQAAPKTGGSQTSPLYPNLGNKGYTVDSYDVSMRYQPQDEKAPVEATTVIKAKASEQLGSFTLDAAGLDVTSVTVDGKTAAFAPDAAKEKLSVTPEAPVEKGHEMEVKIAYTVNPQGGGRGWIKTGTKTGFAVAAQPDGAHTVFPCNDIPSNKADFTFHISVPSDSGDIGVASGLKTGQETKDGYTTYQYKSEHPMATELVQIAAGKYKVINQPAVDGVPIRDVVPADAGNKFTYALGLTADQLKWISSPSRLGPFPVETYGILAADTTASQPFNFTGLETQTLTLYNPSYLADKTDAKLIAPHMVHELAHSWFGVSTTPKTWSDNWLSEGHANYYALVYRYEKGWPSANGATTMEEAMKIAYGAGDSYRSLYGPVAQPKNEAAVYSNQAYLGGPLVLYALQQKVGQEKFHEIETAFLKEYKDKSASTDDYIRVAEQVAGGDTGTFLKDWLYGTTTPAMPGHPDWKPDVLTAQSQDPAKTLAQDPSIKSLLEGDATG